MTPTGRRAYVNLAVASSVGASLVGALSVMTNAGNHEGRPYKNPADHATHGRTEKTRD